MRARTEFLLAVGAFAGVILLGYAAGREGRGNLTTDMRTGSTVTGPSGTRALAEVLERSGTRVTRWHQRLTPLLGDSTTTGATVALIQPPRGLGTADVGTVLGLTDAHANLLLAGFTVGNAIACLGWGYDFSVLDSVGVRAPDGTVRGRVNVTFSRDTVPRRRPVTQLDAPACPTVPVSRVDTVLATARGAPVMLRLHRADSPRVILLVSDVSLISNSGLRVRGAPEAAIRAIMEAGPHVIFDEYPNDPPKGSMAAVALAWSTASPIGWALWQLALVGVLAFVAGGVRFGPVRRAIPRERRSPLEHVRALATALASAAGHDVAIASIVRGLQRRLAAGGSDAARRQARVGRADWAEWVARLAGRLPDPKARAQAEGLLAWRTKGQPASAVRAMANAVEDLWDTLHR